MGKRTTYMNPTTKELIWCVKDKQPEGYILVGGNKGQVGELSERISKEELFNYYIIENNNFDTTAKHFNIEPEGVLHSLLKFYDIKKSQKDAAKNRTSTGRSHENYVAAGKLSGKTQKQNWENKSEEEKLAYSKLQSEAHSTEHFKETIREININYQKELKENNPELYAEINLRRSATMKQQWEDNGTEIKQKRKTTEKINRSNRLCRTIAEQKVYDCLIKRYSDLQYDVVVDDRYPFFVDFYIPSKDLFIELNAHPSHGNKPYSGGISECYNLTGGWLEVFSKRDPEKMKTAKENNLNYIVIYPSNTLENNLSFNNGFEDIVELIYNSQK